MPQVDKATFFHIVFWTFVLYTGGYLALQLSTFFSFFTSLKMIATRATVISGLASQRRSPVGKMVFFPWLSL